MLICITIAVDKYKQAEVHLETGTKLVRFSAYLSYFIYHLRYM